MKTKLTTEQKWWCGLTTTQKRQIENLQEQLFDEGFAKDELFVQQKCFEEAVKQLKPIFEIKNENSQLVGANT